ncbi:MAG: TonB-dependent receptor, partial [Sediminibacterium sp.]|nr:TonB-dependent receptor [Sediminibacterium sp.]
RLFMKSFTAYTTVFGLLFILFMSHSSFASAVPGTASLSGQITDLATTKPLPGATVLIPDLKLAVAADASGNYRFSGLPSGTFLVEIKFVGYKSVTKNILLKDAVKEDFKLEESATEISEVVVTGSSKATQIKRNPVPIVSVNKEYLVTNLTTNIIDAIAKVPGVRAVTTGPNVSKPVIRGLGFNRILTLYDGVRQEGQQWGDEHGIEVDPYGIDKVEIIKGPASLSYGSDALAGVVNLIPTQPAPEGKMIGDVTTEYQTNNKYIGGSAMLGATKNGVEWMARITHKQATNYENKYDGRVFGTAFNETDATASIGIHRKWGYSHLNLVLYNNNQEIPDGSRDSASRRFTRQITEADTVRDIVSDADLNSYHIEHLHQLVQHYRAFLNNNFILGNGRLDVNLGFQRSVRREFSHPELYTTPGLYLQLNSYTYDIKYHLPEQNNWNVSIGINGMYQQNTSTNGTEFIIPSYKQFDIGGFALVKKSIDKLDLSGGLRYDVRTFNNDPLYTIPDPATGFDKPVSAGTPGADQPFSKYSHSFSGASGSLGATYNFTEQFSVKANLARGYRAPNIAEISANGVHPGTNIYQIGNDNFNPEFNLQEDIGFVFSSRYAVIQLNLFNNFISNYIYNQKLIGANGSDSVIVAGNQTFKFQQGRANLYGGELNIDLHPVKSLHFENSISVVYGDNKGLAGTKVDDDAKYLPFIPPFHGLSELRLDFASKNFKHGFIKAQVEYYGAQNRAFLAYDTETPTPGYTLFNAGVGGSFVNKYGNTVVSVYLMGNNLFNTAYQDHLNRLKYFEDYPGNFTGRNGIYNMGRNIAFKVSFPINASLKKTS